MSLENKCPRELSEDQEPKYLSTFATKSTDSLFASRVYPQAKDKFRTEFERDYTRIVHSRAFRRLRHKTQVFISPKNDHLCTRLEHSLHVASIGRTISKALRLNNELVAAIAVGHDVGHAPFGHHGEDALRKVAEKHGLTFAHELHSLRVVDQLDSSPAYEHGGLNLTFAVRDGIVCHHGEGFEEKLTPNRGKKPDDLSAATKCDLPATLEGCVVRWADKVAYLGRDLEDALAVEMISENDIPNEVRRTLGVTNRDIIASLVGDIFKNSLDKDYIAVGEEVHNALREFNVFNRERIYDAAGVTRYFNQIDRAVEPMFDEFLGLVEGAKRNGGDVAPLRRARPENCISVLADFLEQDVRSWQEEQPAQLVVDFIAGMTDNFFIASFGELFLPKGTV